MLKLTNVSKTFGKTAKAVDSLSISTSSGEIIGFIGPNGAGKTTTIKMITGILSPDEGEILINGINIKADPIAAKRSFGFVPDSPDMFLRLRGIEFLNFMGDIYQVDESSRRQRIQSLAESFEMLPALTDKIVSYSHGMRQKLMIIGALLHNPPVWILDEPMTGLDPKSAFQLKEMMRAHAATGNTVFFSTHVLDVAEKLCHKVAIISKAKLIYNGGLDELKAKYPDQSLEEIFLEVTRVE